MAHESRRGWAEDLSRKLDAPIVWDERGHAWDTGRRALLDGAASGASHVCVIQDDVILSRGLRSAVESMVAYSGEHPVGLYAFDCPKVRAAYQHNPDPWWSMDGPTWGPGVVVDASHVPDIIAFGDRMRMTAYDTRVWHYYRAEQMSCYYTAPSLVQHRTGHGSLISSGRDRQAYKFGSGEGKDWSVPPVAMDAQTLFPWVSMSKDGRAKRVRRETRAYRMAVRGGWVEVTP